MIHEFRTHQEQRRSVACVESERGARIACGPPPPISAAELEQLTLPQCHDVIGRLAAQVDAQSVEIAQLREVLALMQERMKLDSKNSSKPPSSDGPGSGNRTQRRASQRARGAQKGHKGSARAVLDERAVDRIIDCAPPEVCACGAPVVADGQAVRHQVFDVPPVRAVVNEYRLHAGCCTGCGRSTAPCCRPASRRARSARARWH